LSDFNGLRRHSRVDLSDHASAFNRARSVTAESVQADPGTWFFCRRPLYVVDSEDGTYKALTNARTHLIILATEKWKSRGGDPGLPFCPRCWNRLRNETSCRLNLSQ
jgi:hypothetical protein